MRIHHWPPSARVARRRRQAWVTPLTVTKEAAEAAVPSSVSTCCRATYSVALSVDGRQLTKPVQVLVDPRSDITAAQLATQYQTATQLNEPRSARHARHKRRRRFITQLTALQGQLRRTQGAGAPAPAPPVLADIEAAIKDLRHFSRFRAGASDRGARLPSVSATA